MCNYAKLNFGYTLNTYKGNYFGDKCFHYGSVSGCDEDCPALNHGECEFWKNVEEYLKEKEEE